MLRILLLASIVARAATALQCKVLDCDQRYVLSWTINSAAGTIDMTMEAKSAGWVAVGLSSGGMSAMASSGDAAPSDILIGSVASATVKDYNVKDYVIPTLDAVQDVTLLSFSYNATTEVSRYSFRRPLTPAAGSASQDRAVTPGSTQTIIWATNPNAGSISADGTSMTRHLSDTRGVTLIDFGAMAMCDYEAECAPAPGGNGLRPVEELKSQCLSNGWPAAQAGGDRDDGKAWPHYRIPATPSPSPSPSASPSVGTSPLPSPSPAAPPPPSTDLPTTLPDANATAVLASPDGTFRASWSLWNGTYAVINLVTYAKGWMALGWNSNAGAGSAMAGADYAVAWVTPRTGSTCDGVSDCNIHLSDRYSSMSMMPSLDTSAAGGSGVDHLTLLDAYVTPSFASVTFMRPLYTGSTLGDDADLRNGTAVKLLWSYGATVGDTATGAIGKHATEAKGATAAAVSFVSLAVDAPADGRTPLQISVGGYPAGGGYAIHGVAMIAGYWLLMTLAAWAARHRTVHAVLAGQGLNFAASAGQLPPAASGARVHSLGDRIAAFHGKHRWFLLHVYLHTAAILSITVGLIAILITTAGDSSDGDAGQWHLHQKAGVAALACAYCQFAVGLARPGLQHPYRPQWLTAHRTLAVATFLAAYIAIPTGLATSGLTIQSRAVTAAVAMHMLCTIVFTLALEDALSERVADACCGGRRRKARAAVSGGGSAGASTQAGSATAASGALPAAPVMTSVNPVAATTMTAAVPAGAAGKGVAFDGSNSKLGNSGAAGGPAAHKHVLLSVAGAIAVVIPAVLCAFVANAGNGAQTYLQAPLASGTSAGRNVTANVTYIPPAAGRRLMEQRTVAAAPRAAAAIASPVPYPYEFRNYSDPSAYPGGNQSLCYHMYEHTVSTAATSYMCRAFAMPQNVSQLHSVEFLPLVDNPSVVHHIVLLGSLSDLSNMAGIDSRGVFDCAAMPSTTGVLYVWAVGGLPLRMPTDVGLRVGVAPGQAINANMNSVPYAILQIHYSNPSGTTGIVDGSGVLMRVTDAGVKYDAGMLLMGATLSAVSIPPNKTGYGLRTVTTVPANLPQPVTAFATMYHAHTMGKRLWTELQRSAANGGVRVLVNGSDVLGREDAYDFGTQRFLPVQATIMAGDTMTTRCIFENTVERGQRLGNPIAAAGQTVTGGESTDQEMCMAFLFYYPKQPLPSSILLSTPVNFCDDAPASGLPNCTSYF